MLQSLKYNLILFKQLIFILLVYSLLRILFFVFNYNQYSELNFFELISLLFYGIRFDIPVIIYSNLLFIFISIFPNPYRQNIWTQKLLFYLFVFTNSTMLLFAFADLKYFQFIQKRSTVDIFKMSNDIWELLPNYISDYWFLFLLYLVAIVFVVVVSKKSSLPKVSFEKNNLIDFKQWIFFLIVAGVMIIGIRGGTQLRPIQPVDALRYTDFKYAAIITNTPMTLLYSFKHPHVEEKKYFEQDSLKQYFSILHQPKKNLQFLPYNVCIIILESFSTEFFKSYHANESYVPFLDSLINHSLIVDFPYANGKRSIESVTSALCGLPALMEEPYLFSTLYGDNKINSVASCLKKKGYSSSFFHGANNGSMMFDNFSSVAGFENYYGRNEYNNDKDFDGFWGIYDEPFFQFTANKIKSMPQPFLATLFSVTSHSPYPIPEKYKGKLKQGSHPNFQAANYTDLALRKFFENISKESWFENTLFVITGDHVGEGTDEYYHNRVGMYSVPIIFYKLNSNLVGRKKIIAQQLDLMNSILDYLNYDEYYVSFGSSIFDSTSNHYSINYLNNVYQIIDSNYVLHFDGQKTIGLYHHKTDWNLQNNVIDEKKDYHYLEKKLKAIIQTYNNCLIYDKYSVE